MTTPTLSPYDLGVLQYAVWNDWAVVTYNHTKKNTTPPPQYTPDAGDMDALADFWRGIADAKNGDERAIARAFAHLDGYEDDEIDALLPLYLFEAMQAGMEE